MADSRSLEVSESAASASDCDVERLSRQLDGLLSKLRAVRCSVADWARVTHNWQSSMWPVQQPEFIERSCRLLDHLAQPASIRDRFVWKVHFPHLRLCALLSGGAAEQPAGSLASPEFEWPDLDRVRFRLRLRPCPAAAGVSGAEATAETAVAAELLLLRGGFDDLCQWPLTGRLQLRLIDLQDAGFSVARRSGLFTVDRCQPDCAERCCCVLDSFLSTRHFLDSGSRFVKEHCAYLEARIVR